MSEQDALEETLQTQADPESAAALLGYDVLALHDALKETTDVYFRAMLRALMSGRVDLAMGHWYTLGVIAFQAGMLKARNDAVERD